MKVSIRVNACSVSGFGDKSLSSMERHGKRKDKTSKDRKIADIPPLAYGTLNIVQAFKKHTKDCRMNAALKKPALHALIQFPSDLPITPENEIWMLQAAMAFINQNYGGDAVFAARLDRDELGKHSVDVFFAPKYEKTTKKGVETWISTTKHAKELCMKHRSEIEDRHQGQFFTGPRQVGIALNSELISFVRNCGLTVLDKVQKNHTGSDRVTPEQYKNAKVLDDLQKQITLLERKNKALESDFNKIKSFLGMIANVIEPLQEQIPPKIMAVLRVFLKALPVKELENDAEASFKL